MKKLLILALLSLLISFAIAKPNLVATQSQETLCLASNVYFEARGESFRGKLAVAMVTLNRTRLPDYPDTICGVVYQKDQFSWTRKKHKITDMDAWSDAIAVANLAIENPQILGNFKATHYHNTSVNPNWGLAKLGRIQHHVFYM